MIDKAKKLIESQEINIAGAVINNINTMRDDYYYYYHTYQSEYYRNSDDNVDEAETI